MCYDQENQNDRGAHRQGTQSSVRKESRPTRFLKQVSLKLKPRGQGESEKQSIRVNIRASAYVLEVYLQVEAMPKHKA